MSFDAIKWAMAQPVAKSSAKFVLVAMADCVNGEGGSEMVCWPSTQHLAEATAQDRKTVLEGMRRLREAGFIEDTGERRGATGQVTVYRLKSPGIGTVNGLVTPISGAAEPESKSAASGTVSQQDEADRVGGNSTETGTGPESGTVPNLDGNSTEFPCEQSQFSLETVPKTGHGTTKEPRRNKEGTTKKAGFDPTGFPLPQWLDRADWIRWCEDRRTRKKPITEHAAPLQLKALADYRRDGFDAREVIEHSIANGYQGLFPPKRGGRANTSSRHGGFRDRNYDEGVTDGIPDA